jgi:hypothetical protein
MQIYFARSIRGAHRQDDNLTFNTIVNAIREAGHVPALDTKLPEHLYEPMMPEDRYVYRRDIYWLDHSQAMIAEVSNASLGVGYEIAYAKHVRHIPILALADKDRAVSAMIAGDLAIVYYRDIQDLAAQCREFMFREVKPV